MKRLLAAFSVALVGVGLVAGTGIAFASPEPPAGYKTKTVKDAGLTIVVPETFAVTRVTRKEAKAMLDANPQLRDAGATVDTLRQFSVGGDFDGDGKADVSAEVQVWPEASIGSPAQLRQKLEALGYRDISVSKSKVAGRRAVVGDYVGERTLPDGTTIATHFTEYQFKSPLGAAIAVGFGRHPGDEQHEGIIDTMINSVRFLRR